MNFTVFSTTLHDLAYRVSDSKWQYVVGSWKTWRADYAAQCWVWKVFRAVNLLNITSLVGSTGQKIWKTWRAIQARLVLFGRAGSFSATTATARVALLKTFVQFRLKMIQKLCVLNWSQFLSVKVIHKVAVAAEKDSARPNKTRPSWLARRVF